MDRRHQELLNEVVRTDNREFRQELREDEKLLDSLLSRVQQQSKNFMCDYSSDPAWWLNERL
jgi:hypothetical protein